MKIKAQNVLYLTILVAAAVIGLIVLQVYLLQSAMTLKRNTFEQNVNLALGEIVQKLDKKETVAQFLQVMRAADSLTQIPGLNTTDSVTVVTGHSEGDRTAIPPGGKRASLLPEIDFDNIELRIKIIAMDSTGKVIQNITDGFKSAGEHEYNLPFKKREDASVHLSFIADSSKFMMKINRTGDSRGYSFSTGQERQRIIHEVMDAFFLKNKIPVEERLDASTLDSMVTATLSGRGIDTKFEYGIFKSIQDTVVLASNAGFVREIKNTKFRRGLFPNDIFDQTNFLALYFPEQRLYLFGQIQTSVITTFIFLLIIIISFVITVRTIFKQKEFAERLKSFINNMTHEFKTPISTIALASESLKSSRNAIDSDKVKRYSKIIFDENARMRDQVDKILQMAVLENGDFELSKSAVDLHELVEEMLSKISLQIEKQKGKIETNLKAPKHLMQGDRVHLMNVISNILDNALKYTKEAPEISVSTTNKNGTMQLRINDNGIGLNQEDQKRVFEKYYRVPTGNRHDVKGFGLGLSYVKLIVEAHGGTVEVISKAGGGSEFMINLPV